jgi:hypothetical protein
MSDDGQLGKLKEQYVDDIINIVPLSQAVFIVLMVLTSDYLISGSASSVLQAFSQFGLKSSLGPENGRFWSVSVLPICIAFAAALLNTVILQKLLSRSLRVAKIGESLNVWQRQAVTRVQGLSDDKKQIIYNSIKPEIEVRLKKFKGKRIAVELFASLLATVMYSGVLIVILSYQKGFQLEWKFYDGLFLLLGSILCVALHRSSVRYAIAKILPLKVYAGVLTGELVFFEEICG